MRIFINIFLVLCLFAFSSELVLAKDLVAAAASAQSLFNRIGIAAVSIGITAGGILFALGLAQVGRYVLFSGLIGAAAVLGAPALVSALRSILG